TVRAAISSAVSSDRPLSSWLSLMCSYWRSRLALHAAWGIVVLLRAGLGEPTDWYHCRYPRPAGFKRRAPRPHTAGSVSRDAFGVTLSIGNLRVCTSAPAS